MRMNMYCTIAMIASVVGLCVVYSPVLLSLASAHDLGNTSVVQMIRELGSQGYFYGLIAVIAVLYPATWKCCRRAT